jgi:hypothetical protein
MDSRTSKSGCKENNHWVIGCVIQTIGTDISRAPTSKMRWSEEMDQVRIDFPNETGQENDRLDGL